MPLHDFECTNCNHNFEELHSVDERVACPLCSSLCVQLVSPLADYTGQHSLTVQYATRNAPKDTVRDSHITQTPTDNTFLRKAIPTVKVN